MVNSLQTSESEVNENGSTSLQTRAPRNTSPADNIFVGVVRLLTDHGWSCLTEVSLANGRRADVLGLNRKGELMIVEVKSCLADFASDGKWRDYLPFCDRFAFAVDENFPRDRLPEDVGVILADQFGGAFIVEPSGEKLAAARRKSVTVKFARNAADRLYRLKTDVMP